MLIVATSLSAHATDFAGRGVFLFPSDSGCPLSPLLGESKDCNRIALDDVNSRVKLDTAARTIQFTNASQYGRKTIVGDVLLHGTGKASDGKRVPLSFHLVLSKSGDAWSVSYHTHAPIKGKFDEVRVDPYQVRVSGPDGEQTVLVPEKISATLSDPSLSERMAKTLVQVRDNRARKSEDADIEIALGVGRAATSVMRARFRTEAMPATHPSGFLQQGTWAFALEALTGKIPVQVVQRELFLTGIDRVTLVQPLVERGFNKHNRLVVGALNGKGYIRYGDHQQDFPGAKDAAHAFLQQSFIGLILGWHQTATRVGAH